MRPLHAALHRASRGRGHLKYGKRHRIFFRALCEVACKRIVRHFFLFLALTECLLFAITLENIQTLVVSIHTQNHLLVKVRVEKYVMTISLALQMDNILIALLSVHTIR